MLSDDLTGVKSHRSTASAMSHINDWANFFFGFIAVPNLKLALVRGGFYPLPLAPGRSQISNFGYVRQKRLPQRRVVPSISSLGQHGEHSSCCSCRPVGD